MEWLRFDWTAIVAERKIKEAIDEGVFDNVPGAGEPLNLEGDIFLSPEQRITNKILKNAQALPEWIQLEKDIEREREELQVRRERALRALRAAKNEATRTRVRERLRAEHREGADMINTMITKYNFITPFGAQKAFAPFVLKREMAALEGSFHEVTGGDGTSEKA